LAYDNLNHVHVAIKVPKAGITNEYFYSLSSNEFNVLREMRHPNVIGLYSAGIAPLLEDGFPDAIALYIAMEHAKGGMLFDFIYHTGPISECEARYFFH
jgi:serine/threonine protein kinase